MMTREDFYAKTFVAQVKACKRFDYDEDLLNNAFDTLQQARNLDIVNHDEEMNVINMVSYYFFNTHILIERGFL